MKWLKQGGEFLLFTCIGCSKENKLPRELIELADRKPTIGTVGPVQVGLMGFLRYRTIFPLFEVVAKYPDQFQLNIWGDGPLREETEQFSATHSNIDFHGSFSKI